MVARVFWEDLVRVRLSAPRRAIWAYSKVALRYIRIVEAAVRFRLGPQIIYA